MAPSYVIDFTAGWSCGEPQAVVAILGPGDFKVLHAEHGLSDLFIKFMLARNIRKLLRWSQIAKWYPLDRRCPPARARKNYWRLCARYPEIMRRLGLTELSVYQ
jgi:hypothetical protein